MVLTIADMRGIKRTPSSPAKTVDTARCLLDLLAAAASLMIARNTSGLVVVDLGSIPAFAAYVEVRLGVALHRAGEWRCQC